MVRIVEEHSNLAFTAAERRLLQQNPYLQLSSLELPKTVQDSFPLIEGFLLSSPLIAEALRKLATYPITSIIYESEDENTKKLWKYILEEVLELPERLSTINFNYLVYGNAFISVTIPMEKSTTCPNCGRTFQLSKAKVTMTQQGIIIDECPECKAFISEFKIIEKPKLDPKQLNLLMWNPKGMIIEYNPYTGQREYWYMPSKEEVSLYRTKSRKSPIFMKQLLETPLTIIKATLKKQAAHIKRDKIFHMAAPSMSGWDQAWGCPRVLFTLKHLYYLQIMLRAQEAVLRDHMIPLRVIHLPTAVQGMQQIVDITLREAKDKLIQEIEKWKKDPNYISVVPIPLQYSNFSGQGRALSMIAEIQEWTKQIIASLGVPLEFVMGGLTWSGSNVSLRMLENDLITMRNYDEKLLNFVVKQVRTYFQDFPGITVRLSEFRMADDISRHQQLLNLASSGFVSMDTVFKEIGINFDQEVEKRIRENEHELTRLKVSQLKQDLDAQFEIEKEKRDLAAILQRRAQPAQRGEETPQPQEVGQQEQQPQQQPEQKLPPEAAEEKQMQEKVKETEEEQLPEQKPPRRSPEKAQI